MIRYLLAALLVCSALAGASASYTLSPAFAPTAFQGQYYTVQFRVRGLDYPKFTFTDLPKCFTGSNDGSISGTPDAAGSFPITIKYSNSQGSGSAQIVIRVSPSVSSFSSSAGVEASILTSTLFSVNLPANDDFVHSVGDSITITLSQSHGQGPFTWSYYNLPAELQGDKSGNIRGSFKSEGYYTFSSSCSDAVGNVAESYLTLNIQPKTLVKSSSLVDVPNRAVPLQYDPSQVLNQQLAANDAVFAAIANVNSKQQAANAKQGDLGKTMLTLNAATAQENATEVDVAEALAERDSAEQALDGASKNLDTAKNNVALAQTALKNSNGNTAALTQALKDAQKAFDAAKQALTDANNNFIKANDAVGAAQSALKQAQADDVAAKNAFNAAFNEVQNDKAALQAAYDKAETAGGSVSNGQDALNIVNQANDDALAAFKKADKNLNDTLAALDKANKAVESLRAKTNAASTDLGVSQFNLQQALNNLYVAQARKEAADKATAIAGFQSAQLPDPNGTTQYIFNGCVAPAFPSISGTAAITNLYTDGFTVSSGHRIIYGSCTIKDNCKVGDVISYSGYVNNGVVNANSIKLSKF